MLHSIHKLTFLRQNCDESRRKPSCLTSQSASEIWKKLLGKFKWTHSHQPPSNCWVIVIRSLRRNDSWNEKFISAQKNEKNRFSNNQLSKIHRVINHFAKMSFFKSIFIASRKLVGFLFPSLSRRYWSFIFSNTCSKIYYFSNNWEMHGFSHLVVIFPCEVIIGPGHSGLLLLLLLCPSRWSDRAIPGHFSLKPTIISLITD